MGLEWKKVRAAMWSGRDNGMMYTIRQRGDATFYVTRGIERSHFGARAGKKHGARRRNRAHQEAEEVELGARPFCAAAGLIAVCNEATIPAVGAAAAAMNMSARPDARESADVVILG